LQNFDFEGTPVWVQIDFALVDGGKIVLFDWKTGKVRYDEMDVQLSCYGLYSHQNWDVALENIVCKTYNLRIDKADDYEINDEVVEKVKAHMRDSIASMKKLLVDEENNVAREEDFEVTEDDKICRSCNFKKVCPKWD